MLDYLKNLYIESSQHPTLTAGDLLRYLYEPENINMLQHNVGKTRSRFILQTLLQAQQAYKHDKTPLATFLAPVIHSHNNELRYTHSNLMDDESYTSPSSW
jgi:hypothetical protein